MSVSHWLVAAVAVGITTAPVAAQKSTHFGVKAGVLMPGEAYVEESDSYFDIDMSFGVGGFVDYRMGEKIIGALYLDLQNISAYDDTALMLEGGFGLKAIVGGGDGKLTWRPGFGVGYANLDENVGADATQYLTLHAGVELLLPSQWLFEATLYAAPTGGNDAITVSFGPMVQLRAGRLF